MSLVRHLATSPPNRRAMRPERYNPKEAEPKWQAAWAERDLFRCRNDDPRPFTYVLEMFPYPSGRIHMGHVRNYAMGDVVARYKRAKGFNVLHPMGWDAFGMPAENAAMQNKVHPKEWTYANIDTMRAQLKSMGLSLDWLGRWREKVGLMQKNWIGRSEGLVVRFPLDPATAPHGECDVGIFTTRP